MKRTAKKCVVACLVMSLLLAMLPMISVSAATPAIDIITDSENKTIAIDGYLPEEAGEQISIVIMDSAFEGGIADIMANLDLVVALDQVSVDADGYYSYFTVIPSFDVINDAEKPYKAFVNGGEAEEIVFDAPVIVEVGDTVNVPIIANNCEDLAGLIGEVSFDDAYWAFDGVTAAAGFEVQTLPYVNSKFAIVSEDGQGVDGDVVIGWVVLTAIAPIDDEGMTSVDFDVYEAYDSALNETSTRIDSFKFEIYDDLLLGDVNLDGEVKLTDAILLLQYLSENVDLSKKALRVADILADGVVNTADAVVIMQICL